MQNVGHPSSFLAGGGSVAAECTLRYELPSNRCDDDDDGEDDYLFEAP